MDNELDPTRKDGGQGDKPPFVTIVWDEATHTVGVNAKHANTTFYRAMCDMAKEALRAFDLGQALAQGPGVVGVRNMPGLPKIPGH